jgi:hypothetical protein
MRQSEHGSESEDDGSPQVDSTNKFKRVVSRFFLSLGLSKGITSNDSDMSDVPVNLEPCRTRYQMGTTCRRRDHDHQCEGCKNRKKPKKCNNNLEGAKSVTVSEGVQGRQEEGITRR